YLRGIILTAHNYINKNIFLHIIKLLFIFLDICYTQTLIKRKYMDMNTSNLQKPIPVQKEDIEKLIFPQESIERTEEQTRERNRNDCMGSGRKFYFLKRRGFYSGKKNS